MAKQLEKEIEEHRQKGILLMKKKNDLLHTKLDIFREENPYLYVIKRGEPNPRIAIFDTYQKAKKCTPEYSNSRQNFYVHVCDIKKISDNELLKINKLPRNFSSYWGYISD